MKKVDIEKTWFDALKNEFEKPYFISIRDFLREEYKKKEIYPHPSNIFNAFNSTPIPSVKVVIVGQDPYHGFGQAHGLCFSVLKDVSIPPSLKNIYKELSNDLGVKVPSHGNLSSWAQQGVLLINSVLTVEKGKANSHKNIGWERFTECAINKLSKKTSNVVFMLWGNQAHKKERFIDNSRKHLILKTVHPSPLSAYNGFFGCKHFSKANIFLKKYKKKEIEWEII
tara:strand:+ start:139 stop:816 length:678 start_codon:yes stop_codon:yes gene_type:complete